MRIRVLGSGTLVPHPLRGSPGYWIELPEARILMDCGSGTLRTMARLGLAWERTTHVFLTHFHTDHVADVAPLLFAMRHGTDAPRTEPLSLLGPKGLNEHIDALAEAHGAFVREPGFPLRVLEMAGGRSWDSEDGSFRAEAFATNHTEASLAYRLEAQGGILGYTGDTGPDPGLGLFMRGAGLLLAECSHADGRSVGRHLTPSELCTLASAASPDLLVTVHAYPPLDPEEVPHLLAEAGYEGEVVAGFDGMAIRVSADGCTVERDAE